MRRIIPLITFFFTTAMYAPPRAGTPFAGSRKVL
jgi:hypothetical protein